MDDVRWLDEREARAWRALQLMQMQLTARLARDLSERSNLSYQDYLVLVALTDRTDGRMRLFELGHALGWEKSRVSHHLTRMEERGLVVREPCGTDRRGAFVAVTAEGREGIAAAAPGHLEMVRSLFIDRLTPGQLDTIAAVAESVLAGLNEDAEGFEAEAGS